MMDWKKAYLNRFKYALNRLEECEKTADASLKNGKLTEEQYNDLMFGIAASRNMYNEFLNKVENPTLSAIMKGE